MYRVNLDHDVAFVERECRESPWGTVHEFNAEVASWLDAHLADEDWDFEDWMRVGSERVTYGAAIYIRDKRTAILCAIRYGHISL